MPASLFLIHIHVLEPIMSEITNVDVIPTLTNELFRGSYLQQKNCNNFSKSMRIWKNTEMRLIIN